MTPDKLHEIEKGVFQHLLSWFMEMLKCHHGLAGLQELDWRFIKTPRFGGLKRFPQGITEHSGLTAKDYRQIGKVNIYHDFIIQYRDNASYYIKVIGYPPDNK
jgi:hypothetical protein